MIINCIVFVFRKYEIWLSIFLINKQNFYLNWIDNRNLHNWKNWNWKKKFLKNKKELIWYWIKYIIIIIIKFKFV